MVWQHCIRYEHECSLTLCRLDTNKRKKVDCVTDIMIGVLWWRLFFVTKCSKGSYFQGDRRSVSWSVICSFISGDTNNLKNQNNIRIRKGELNHNIAKQRNDWCNDTVWKLALLLTLVLYDWENYFLFIGYDVFKQHDETQWGLSGSISKECRVVITALISHWNFTLSQNRCLWNNRHLNSQQQLSKRVLSLLRKI